MEAGDGGETLRARPSGGDGHAAAHAEAHGADALAVHLAALVEVANIGIDIRRCLGIAGGGHQRAEDGAKVALEDFLGVERPVGAIAVIHVRQQHHVAGIGQALGHGEHCGANAAGIHVEDDRRAALPAGGREQVGRALAVWRGDDDLLVSHVDPPVVVPAPADAGINGATSGIGQQNRNRVPGDLTEQCLVNRWHWRSGGLAAASRPGCRPAPGAHALAGTCGRLHGRAMRRHPLRRRGSTPRRCCSSACVAPRTRRSAAHPAS